MRLSYYVRDTIFYLYSCQLQTVLHPTLFNCFFFLPIAKLICLVLKYTQHTFLPFINQNEEEENKMILSVDVKDDVKSNTDNLDKIILD